MINIPAPLVPLDVDLSDFPFMPLDVRRLRDSKLATSAGGEAFRAAVLLWCAAWHQLPAASLPDDDAELSQLSGFGRAVKEWKKIRDGALYGWIKCSDGRLYHPVVAEKALDAWKKKQEQKIRTIKARIAAFEKRLKDAMSESDISQLNSLIQKLNEQLPQSLSITKKYSVTEKKECQSQKNKKSVTDIVTETNREGEGEGEGQREGEGEGLVYVTASEPAAPPIASPASPSPPPEKSETELQANCKTAWTAYQQAFFDRYGTEPVRNAKINAMVKQLVQRLGAEEVSHVIRYFVGHNGAFYVQRCHDFGNLLADAEKLRTEWATGRTVTRTSAMQTDRTQSNLTAAQEALKILENHRATA